jgi:hypothetical protein
LRPRKHLIVLGTVLLALAGAGAAAAGWSRSSAGSGDARAVSMPAGSTPTAAIGTYPNLTVSWAGVTVSGAAVSSYTIRRYSEAGVLQAITAGCNGAIAATTCTESGVPAGRWQYTSQPVKGAWSGAESSRSATHEIAAPPTTVMCSNCTTFGSTSYINNAGKLSVNIQVALPASSLVTDTVHLTLADGASHTVTAATQSAAGGAGTLTFSGLNTSTLVDGNVTATAWVTTNTSESSPNTTATLVRDTVGPTATNINGTSGSTAGSVDAADTLVYTFSEPMAPASIRSGWDGTAVVVTSTLAPGTLNDTITVAGSSLGTVNTRVDYVLIAAATCSSTLVYTGNAATLTIGSCTFGIGGSFAVLVGSSTFDWAPSTAATDRAGNPMTSTTASESGGPKANF